MEGEMTADDLKQWMGKAGYTVTAAGRQPRLFDDGEDQMVEVKRKDGKTVLVTETLYEKAKATDETGTPGTNPTNA
jgi:hypothetical protein